jgi:hypothetical protein
MSTLLILAFIVFILILVVGQIGAAIWDRIWNG